MGIISNGIFGGFSGTVGNIVGGSWKGINYIRSKPVKRAIAATPAQLEQREKFKIVIRFVNCMSGLLEVSFKNYAIKMTGVNSAFAYTFKNAVTGYYPAYSIDYTKVLLSRGDLPNALSPSAIATANSAVAFAWTDNSGIGITRTKDKAILVVYCPEMNCCIYNTEGAFRSAVSDTINVSTFSGKLVVTYLGFISEDGKEVANSLYTGQFIVS